MEDTVLQELRQELAQLSASLPQSIDLAAVSRFKAPGKVMILRESLIWRQEEVGRSALSSLDAGDLVAAALLTRSAMETTGAVVYLHSLVNGVIKRGFSEGLEKKLTEFLTGSRVWDDLGGAIHVSDFLREVEKVIPGFLSGNYAMLSEFAHPNWSGTFGAFGTTLEKDLIVEFSRGGKNPAVPRGIIQSNLAGSVGLFTYYYDLLADMIVPFTQAVEAFRAKPNRAPPPE